MHYACCRTSEKRVNSNNLCTDSFDQKTEARKGFQNTEAQV